MKYMLMIITSSLIGGAVFADSCCSTNPPPSGTTPTEGSLYHLESVYQTSKGEPVQLSDLSKKPTIMGMFYSTCPSVCPMLVTTLQQIEKKLGPEAEYSIVLVSFDPDRDTPKVLADFAEEWKLDPDHWQLWTGKQADVRSLAAVLGIQYRKGSDGSIAHNAPIVLLNTKGEVQLKLEAPGLVSDEWIAQLRTHL